MGGQKCLSEVDFSPALAGLGSHLAACLGSDAPQAPSACLQNQLPRGSRLLAPGFLKASSGERESLLLRNSSFDEALNPLLRGASN